MLQNKNAVVTGASMGIGKAVAMELARRGANVVVNSSGNGPAGPGSDPESLDTVVAEIKSLGGTAIASCGSVADFEYAGELIQLCVNKLGAIDILINIAGVGEGKGSSMVEIDFDNWNRVIGVHLTGTFNTCRHALPFMVDQKDGAIINTSSHAFLGSYGGSAYAAAKGGINSLSAAMARDFAEHNIRCNIVFPGAKTRLSSGADYVAQIRQLNKRGLLDDQRMESALNPAPPAHIAPVYAFLASDKASSLTGKMFTASGSHLGEFPWPDERVMAVGDPNTRGAWQYQEVQDLLTPAADAR
ncbi:MAG: SDR family NAD(P)-dependent oxidoreductase [Halieaceae bacterium]|nr:SDR family NAD(P)-dependent oxidoreductase [Halieaceae bacterium]